MGEVVTGYREIACLTKPLSRIFEDLEAGKVAGRIVIKF